MFEHELPVGFNVIVIPQKSGEIQLNGQSQKTQFYIIGQFLQRFLQHPGACFQVAHFIEQRGVTGTGNIKSADVPIQYHIIALHFFILSQHAAAGFVVLKSGRQLIPNLRKQYGISLLSFRNTETNKERQKSDLYELGD